MDMKADDTALVDDILNELNNNNEKASLPNESNQNVPISSDPPTNQAPVINQRPVNNNIAPPQTQPPQQQLNMPVHSSMANLEQSQGMEMNNLSPMEDMDMMGDMPPDVEVTLDNNESKINKILLMMKKPLIVVALSFILHHPLTSKLLAKYLPTVFSPGGSNMKINVQILCISLILGLLFLIINMVL